MKKTPLTDLDTYVFVDTSNIRSACLATLGFKIDFGKFMIYLRKKYPKLKEVRYYEGISRGDKSKQEAFRKLRKVGYTVCALSRKAYENPPVYKRVKCPKCKYTWDTQVLKKSVSLKSNVDVYLATELLGLVYSVKRETHIVLVSCDGDYAEMIKAAVAANPKISITVMGTPVVRSGANTFSMRLQVLRNKLPRFKIMNIQNIQPRIEQE